MTLYAAMIDLLRPGDDVRAVTESLKVYVADAPSLITIIENRLKPSPNDEQMRQMAEEDARRKRKSEREQTKARASWVKFWKAVANEPDVMFDDSRAENTAWNFWQAMERAVSFPKIISGRIGDAVHRGRE
jgi:hypothetical protein